jgi:hypothetical protein
MLRISSDEDRDVPPCVRVPAHRLPPSFSHAALASGLVPSSAFLRTRRGQAHDAPPSAQEAIEFVKPPWGNPSISLGLEANHVPLPQPIVGLRASQKHRGVSSGGGGAAPAGGGGPGGVPGPHCSHRLGFDHRSPGRV